MKSASEWAGIWFSPGEAAKKLARMMGGTVFPPQPETIAHCEKMVRAIQRDALEAAADELEDESSQWGSVSPATDALGSAMFRIRALLPPEPQEKP